MSGVKYFPAARVGDLSPGEAIKIEVAGKAIALFNVEDTYFATDDRCTHADASLTEGFVLDDVVECPLHGATFSIKTGEALSAPATEPLTTYLVKVEGGEILVGIPQP